MPIFTFPKTVSTSLGRFQHLLSKHNWDMKTINFSLLNELVLLNLDFISYRNKHSYPIMSSLFIGFEEVDIKFLLLRYLIRRIEEKFENLRKNWSKLQKINLRCKPF